MHNGFVPVETSDKDESSNISKTLSKNRRGRGRLAATGKGRNVTSKNSTSTTLPPGLAATKEGNSLSRFLGDRVAGDQKISVTLFVKDNNELEKTKYSCKVCFTVWSPFKLS